MTKREFPSFSSAAVIWCDKNIGDQEQQEQVVFLLNGVLGNFHSNILPITPLPSSSSRYREPLGAFFNQAEAIAAAQGNEEWILWLTVWKLLLNGSLKNTGCLIY